MSDRFNGTVPTGSKVAIIVGPTGSGKSSLIKLYCTGEAPVVGSGVASSVTTSTKQFAANIGGQLAQLFDTPGLGDTEERDQVFLDDMVQTLQTTATGIHKFYFVMSVHETRYNQYLQVCLSLLLQLAPDLKEKPSILTVILTKADLATRSSWDQNGDIEARRAEFKQVIAQRHGVNIDVILHGTDNRNEFIQNFTSAPLSVYSQTQFMRNVQTLDTQRKQAYEELEKAKTENASDKEKIAELQKVYDQKNTEATQAQANLAAEVQNLKNQLEQMKANSGGGGGGGFCVLV